VQKTCNALKALDFMCFLHKKIQYVIPLVLMALNNNNKKINTNEQYCMCMWRRQDKCRHTPTQKKKKRKVKSQQSTYLLKLFFNL